MFFNNQENTFDKIKEELLKPLVSIEKLEHYYKKNKIQINKTIDQQGNTLLHLCFEKERYESVR